MPPPAVLLDLAKSLVEKGPVKIEDCPRRIRILLDKEYIADTTHAKYVWEHPYYPQYYVPRESVKSDIWTEAKELDGAFTALYFKKSPMKTPHAILLHTGGLKGYVRFDWGAMDAWYEEEQEVYVHPLDPHCRVDIRPCSREIKVVVDGVEVAKTTNSMILFETGAPPRYYLLQTSVRQDILSRSDTLTSCPYKGDANYYNVTVNGKEYKDLIWWYKFPTHDSAFIAGRYCFYNEKVDIFIDGEKLVRPKTHFVTPDS